MEVFDVPLEIAVNPSYGQFRYYKNKYRREKGYDSSEEIDEDIEEDSATISNS